MFTPHILKLSNGIEMFYTDNGPVPNSKDYTTLIMIHGTAITGHTFEKLHEFSHSFNLRTVLLNRRDYPGSTKYTDEELDDLTNGRRVFLDRMSGEMAEFINTFIEKEHIPKISADGKNGGIALVGWSMGAATALTLLSDPKLLRRDLYQTIESYVKNLVLYDPPCYVFGHEYPSNQVNYNPWLDPDFKTREEIFNNFVIWVSSYYDHGSTPAEFDYRKRTEKYTVSSWTLEERSKNINFDVIDRSELPMFSQMQPELKRLAQRALFDPNYTQSFFPRVNVTYITASMSIWDCVWAGIVGRNTYDEHLARGEKVRETHFFVVEGNHFVHYDNPPMLFDAIVRGFQGERVVEAPGTRRLTSWIRANIHLICFVMLFLCIVYFYHLSG